MPIAELNCELHSSRLVKMKVPIFYGMPSYDRALEVAGKLFPNSHKRVIGGCLVDESFPRFAEKMVCRECRRAEALWRKNNQSYD